MDTLLAATLAHLVQVFGGSLGAAIVALSTAARLALLPLTFALARRNLRRQSILRALQPEIDGLRKRFEKSPENLFVETHQLYRRHNCQPFDLPALFGGFAQLPVFALLYGAIRRSIKIPAAFLWIKSLAAPDAALTVAVLLLTGLSAYLAPGLAAPARMTLITIQVILTAAIVWKLAAGLGLYWAVSNSVGLLQTIWLRSRMTQEAKPA